MTEHGLHPAFATQHLRALLNVDTCLADLCQNELTLAREQQSMSIGSNEAGAFVDLGVLPDRFARAEIKQTQVIGSADLVIEDEQAVFAHGQSGMEQKADLAVAPDFGE